VRAAGVVAALVVWAPRIGHACAVCFSGREDGARIAFIGTTALLTLLPLVMIGGVAWWLWRRACELERQAVSRASSSR
jgi:hypothetical protein